jgi:hypothetical protein
MKIPKLRHTKNPLIGGKDLLTTRRLKKHGFSSQKKRLQAFEKQEKKEQTRKAKNIRGRKKIIRKVWRKLI